MENYAGVKDCDNADSPDFMINLKNRDKECNYLYKFIPFGIVKGLQLHYGGCFESFFGIYILDKDQKTFSGKPNLPSRLLHDSVLTLIKYEDSYKVHKIIGFLATYQDILIQPGDYISEAVKNDLVKRAVGYCLNKFTRDKFKSGDIDNALDDLIRGLGNS